MGAKFNGNFVYLTPIVVYLVLPVDAWCNFANSASKVMFGRT